MRILLAVLLIWPTLALSKQIPLDDLVRHTEIKEVKISPDGTHLAVRKLYEGESVLFFMSIHPMKITGTLRFNGREEVGHFEWANNERIVAEVVTKTTALEIPINYGSLYAINYDGSRGKLIFGHMIGERQVGSRVKKAEATRAHASIIDPLQNEKKEILISTYPWYNNWETRGEVARLNIYSGVKKNITKLPQILGRAYTDKAGNLLYADGTDKENNYQLYFKSKKGWERVKDKTLDSGTLVGFDKSTGEAYLTINPKSETQQLIKVTPGSENYSVVFQHHRSDISNIVYSPGSYKPLGAYLDPDYPAEKFFDEGNGFAPFFRGLKKAFDGYRIKFTSFTTDGSKGVLEVSGDRLPGDYYLVNLKTKAVDFLLSSAEWMMPEQLNPMIADSFTTEDNLQVGVYLTFPKHSEKMNPMVVLPHGGPHARDYWGYDQDAQLLSQNGYLVLQVNFRGSTGYGMNHYTSGFQEWGGKIQKDIADAAHWAIEKGYADPERICIYGISFGGYSALMNPILYPDLYQCAAGYSGAYDLEMLYTKGDVKESERGIAYLKRTMRKNESFLKTNSPIENTDKLNIPVFLIHGGQDERTPIEHAEALVASLKKEELPVKTLFIKNEGHGFYSEENNMRLYTELLEFLDQHIGVGAVEELSNEG
ncbi:alpha/beta hydrolase family protein [Microbulbifer sp. JTAC008]|uniref:alpha/beta hydrolase family protein n=1 Tax=unclassified Microbulbifer TaxID=2619833 RepID=UPI00403A419A